MATDSDGLHREEARMHPVTASIATGGLLFGLFRRMGAMPGGRFDPVRASVLLALLTWLPLVVLTALAGTLAGDAVRVPLLRDPAIHARLLVALPLLLIAERVVPAMVRRTLQDVQTREMLDATGGTALERAVERLVAARDSRIAEAAIVLAVAGLVWALHPHTASQLASGASSWAAGSAGLSPAGRWYVTVSLFVSMLLGVRWIWWLVLWTRFLLGTLRPHLQVMPGHSDRYAGLAFLTRTQGALAPVLASLTVTAAGRLGHSLLYDGMTLASAGPPAAVVYVLCALVMFGPLLPFAPRVARAKREALLGYDRLSQALVTSFSAQWVRRQTDDERLLGDQGPSTLADFAVAYEQVRTTRPVPLDVQYAMPALAAIAAPFVPLLLTASSAKDVLVRVLRLLL